MKMRFYPIVEGPLDIGATMCAFVETRDAAGDLFSPLDIVIHAQKHMGGDAWLDLGYLHPGDKGTGKCELAPLVNGQARYRFRAETALGAASDWALCDLSLPFADTPAGLRAAMLSPWQRLVAWLDRRGGQYHKSFVVTFREGEPPPPPPPPTHEAWVYGPLCWGQEFTAFFRALDVPPGCCVVGEKRLAGDTEWYALGISVALDEAGEGAYSSLLGAGAGGAAFRFRVEDSAGATVSAWGHCDIDAPWARDSDVGGPCRAGTIDGNTYRRPRKSFIFRFVPIEE